MLRAFLTQRRGSKEWAATRSANIVIRLPLVSAAAHATSDPIMDQRDHWRDAFSHGQPAGHDQQQQLPPPPAALTSSGGGGVSPAAFLTYVSIGFGCTIGLIAMGVALWLITR